MENTTCSCPKCGGRMQKGFSFDRAHPNLAKQPGWQPGAPEMTFWGTLKVKDAILVDTYRCEACGYLESFAPAMREA